MLSDTLQKNTVIIVGGKFYIKDSASLASYVPDYTLIKTAYNTLSHYFAESKEIPRKNIRIIRNSYTSTQVENYNANDIEALFRNEIDLCIEHLSRGRTVIIPFYERHCIENKAASMALQRSTDHTIRVYSYGSKTLIVTTELDNQLLIDMLALSYIEAVKEKQELKLLLNQFQKNYTQAKETIMNLLSENNNYLEQAIQKIKNITAKANNGAIENYKANINNRQSTINNVEAELAAHYKSLLDLQKRLTALTFEKSGPLDELTEYMMNNRNIFITHINENYADIDFIIKSPIRNYDKEFCQKYFNRRWSTAESHYKVLTATFIEEKYTLYAKAAFRIMFGELGWAALKQSEFTDDPHFYNPHIRYAACTGTYKSHITKAITNGNFIEALNIMAASTGSINWADTVIIDKLCAVIRNNSELSFEDNKTGELLSYVGVLNKEEAQNAPN